jgi:hypothetical protein
VVVETSTSRPPLTRTRNHHISNRPGSASASSDATALEAGDELDQRGAEILAKIAGDLEKMREP